jgi:hypothetical protein
MADSSTRVNEVLLIAICSDPFTVTRFQKMELHPEMNSAATSFAERAIPEE